VLLGRTSATSAEVVTNQNAVYPQNLVGSGRNDRDLRESAGSANNHCADSFFDHEFDSGVLQPGRTFSHAFNTAGEYFYNDCVGRHITGKNRSSVKNEMPRRCIPPRHLDCPHSLASIPSFISQLHPIPDRGMRRWLSRQTDSREAAGTVQTMVCCERARAMPNKWLNTITLTVRTSTQ